MCLSVIGKYVYAGLMFVTLGVTMAGLFTSHWRDFSVPDGTAHTGLSGGCDFGGQSKQLCDLWWNERPSFEKTVKATCALAGIFEVVAIAWVFLSTVLCCCHSRFMHVLPVWSLMATGLLAATCINFAANKKTGTQVASIWAVGADLDLKLGYSFFLIVAATALSAGSAIFAAMISWLSDKMCC